MERKRRRKGVSYKKRVADVNRIYDEHAGSGLSNREIWRRFIYPVYCISERTFYNMLKGAYDPKNQIPDDMLTLFQFDENGNVKQ